MTSLFLHNGGLLARDFALAIDEECCCVCDWRVVTQAELTLGGFVSPPSCLEDIPGGLTQTIDFFWSSLNTTFSTTDIIVASGELGPISACARFHLGTYAELSDRGVLVQRTTVEFTDGFNIYNEYVYEIKICGTCCFDGLGTQLGFCTNPFLIGGHYYIVRLKRQIVVHSTWTGFTPDHFVSADDPDDDSGLYIIGPVDDVEDNCGALDGLPGGYFCFGPTTRRWPCGITLSGGLTDNEIPFDACRGGTVYCLVNPTFSVTFLCI